MKRRTRLIFIGCAAISGTFSFAGTAAAHVVEPGAHQARQVVTKTSDPPPRVVHAPILRRVTVRPGDTLTAIGARTSRTWDQLAAYNHIPNPNLIYVDQVITIPPVSYVPPSPVVLPVPAAPVAVVPHHLAQTSHYSAPVVHYSAPAPAPQPVATGGGIWACIGQHESGNNAATNTGNGYYGAFQDTISAWRAGGGGPGLPSDYSYSEQLRVNQNLQSQVGWGAWPNTSRMCGV